MATISSLELTCNALLGRIGPAYETLLAYRHAMASSEKGLRAYVSNGKRCKAKWESQWQITNKVSSNSRSEVDDRKG